MDGESEAASRAATVEAERKSNRERMPEIARFVDDLRTWFGPGVKLRWAREGNFEVGRRPEQLLFPVEVVDGETGDVTIIGVRAKK